MYLKNLEIEGFKSFVDSTNLEFRNGFTAIVGPNGCGKSNVSDAIRWVIGEQRSKTLRSTRITDLIFNGSSSRKPVNRAEISLTLSSVPTGIRIAGVPNVAEDVKVTRCFVGPARCVRPSADEQVRVWIGKGRKRVSDVWNLDRVGATI